MLKLDLIDLRKDGGGVGYELITCGTGTRAIVDPSKGLIEVHKSL